MTVSEFYAANIAGKDKDDIAGLCIHLFEILTQNGLVTEKKEPTQDEEKNDE